MKRFHNEHKTDYDKQWKWLPDAAKWLPRTANDAEKGKTFVRIVEEVKTSQNRNCFLRWFTPLHTRNRSNGVLAELGVPMNGKNKQGKDLSSEEIRDACHPRKKP